MYCMFCGTLLPDKALFCPACGAKLTGETKREESELRPVRCTSCGSGELKKVRAGEYRCTHCGTLFYTDGRRPGEEDEARDVKVAVLLSEAQAHAEKGDYQNELRTLAKAMELDPENDTVLLRLGRAYWRLGSVDKTLEYFRRAEELYPGDPVVYVNIGSAFLKLGQYAEAKEQYERGIAIIEADPRSACAEDTAIAYGNYALCVGRLGDKKSAKKYLSLAKEKGYSRESIDTICRQLHLNRYGI